MPVNFLCILLQFDISENNNRSSKGEIPYLMDIQSGSVSILGTRIVVPIRKAANFIDKTISKIHISIEIKNIEYTAFISEMAAVPTGMIGSTVTNGAIKRTEIIASIDLLFTGF